MALKLIKKVTYYAVEILLEGHYWCNLAEIEDDVAEKIPTLRQARKELHDYLFNLKRDIETGKLDAAYLEEYPISNYRVVRIIKELK